MQVIRDPLRQTDLPRGGVGTIGNFDGVHLGHRKILETVVERAREIGRPSFAITFEPHPMAVLRPDRAPRRVQTLRQKEEAIEAIGIETLLVIPFTRDFSLTEPEEFVRTLLAGRLGASELYIGAHFAFGRGKRGDLALLSRLGAECGFVASAVPEVVYEGEPVSSTRIRRALERGAIGEANAMLGRSYELDGLVSRGDRVGPPDRRADDQPRAGERAPSGRRRLCDRDRDPLLRPPLRERDEHRPEAHSLRGVPDHDRDVRSGLLLRRLRREGPALLPRPAPRGAEVPLGDRAEGPDPARHRGDARVLRRPERAAAGIPRPTTP